jgi:CHAT domain-containing protein
VSAKAPANNPPIETVLPATTSVLDFVQQGREFYGVGQFTEALAVWRQATKTLQAQGDSLNEAMVWSNLALTYQQLGQWPQATQAIATSLKLLGVPESGGNSVKLSHSKERSQVLAQALNTQGSLQLASGQPDQALESWTQAAKLYGIVGDRDAVLRSRINQTQALKALGLVQRSLTILEEVNQTLQAQSDSELKAGGLRLLGNTLRSVGNLDLAEKTLQQSLTISRTLQSPSDVSAALLSLGNLSRSQQNLPQAVEFYQQASATATSPLSQVQAELNQLSALLDQQQWLAAESLWPRIQTQLSALPPSHSAIYAQTNFAKSLTQLKSQHSQDSLQWSAIAQLLATAIQQAQVLGDQRAQAYSLGNLGQLYEQTQQWSDAQTVTQQALLLAQSTHASDIAYQWQWQLGRLLQAQDNRAGAIAAYTQAINTLQSLRNDLVAINTDVQFSFRESVEPVYRQFVDLLLQTNGATAPTQQNLAQARAVIESLQLAELDNFFQEACLQAKPVQIDQVDAEAAIIYPIILEDRLEIILSLSGEPLHHYATSVSRSEVEQIASQFRQSISPIARSQDRLRFSHQLYDWLLRPAEVDLAHGQVKTLVFVLDSVLQNLPIAALYDGNQFLIEKYGVALTPSLQLFDPQPLARQKLQVLTGGLTEARQGFSALPDVALELQQITAEVSGKLILNQELTNANLEQQLNKAPFNIVHLATHGQFSSNANETFILTWDDRLNVKQLNGLLQTRDQSEVTPLELLVLSACQTAAGDKRAALGLAGVAVRSGARSTVATLWSVNDEAAANLMAKFYQELAKPGATKAQALRQAQLALLKEPRFRMPYYWSPFVLVGNWL